MCKLLCVTNRKLCRDNFIDRIRSIIDLGIPVILREKDLTEQQYYELLCSIGRKNIIAHSFSVAAEKYGCSTIHLSLLDEHIKEKTALPLGFGVSTHSESEAMLAEKLGASYITAGHVFTTDCKKGLPPKGIELLTRIKQKIPIPVYALGGITPDNAPKAISAGADGVAVMSGFMQCENIKEYTEKYMHILS